MNIRFISSLDSEDELRFATAAFSALTRLLDSMPIAYTIRLETADGKILEHHHSADVSTAVMAEPVDILQSLIVDGRKSS